MRVRAFALLSCLAVSFTPVHAQQPSTPSFQLLQPPGPHPVGLKVIHQYDRARVFLLNPDHSNPTEDAQPLPADPARPLQTLVWYPAGPSTQPPMTVGDYLALAKTEISFDHPAVPADIQRWSQWLAPSSAQPLHAVRDARPAPGRYPIVIYAPSFTSTSWENADLCEYLASFGYIVIASPAMGAHTRASTHDLAGAGAQAQDVSFLIGFAHSLPNADTSRIAALGFSWGGLADMIAAARDPRITALVSLDGSERYFPGIVQSSGDVHPDKMTIPLLYLEEGDQSLEDQDHLNARFHSEGPSVLNEYQHGDLTTIRMLGLFHPEFCAMAHRNEELWQKELPNLQIADYDRHDGEIGYAWVARYVRAFLDANLKRDPAALAFLHATPAANGVPTHTMSIKFRPASTQPQ